MLFRGMYDPTLLLLRTINPPPSDPENLIRKFAIESVAYTRQQQIPAANQSLAEADSICASSNYPACGDVLRAHGIVEGAQGHFDQSRKFYFQTLTFAKVHQDRFLEANALANLSWVALQVEHYDEAVDWSKSAYRVSLELGAKDMAELASGNTGWAYDQLGDGERALDLYLEAEKNEAKLGSIRLELNWIGSAGYVYRDAGDLARAADSYRRQLYLAKEIDSKQDIVFALENLAEISVETGKLGEADSAIHEVEPMERADGRQPNPYLVLTEAKLAAARHQDQQAATLFHAVEKDPSSITTMRLNAGLEMAKLYERQGNENAAEKQYKASLTTFEAARAQVKSEELKLPFTANALPIYDGYIQLLVGQGRTGEALAVADQSRGRTLAQGLHVPAGKPTFGAGALRPRVIAQKTCATLLYYWLGEKQSYLWAITPAKIVLFPLPAKAEIVARVKRYRKALLNMENPAETGNEDGRALYEMLVAPAAGLMGHNAPVTILADGALNELNFETLLAPGPAAGADTDAKAHYWIEDETLVSAPSLSMLAATPPRGKPSGKMLLIGDAVSPSDDFPQLPMASMEMKLIEKHFTPRTMTVIARDKAVPESYGASKPGQYTYMHFVTHATASPTSPLDSAVILSRSPAEINTFKLYAREIVQYPIDAKLVTISACNGSGTRAYSGEGLIGLSWAFLRAGAHNVIGTLWEVADDSTPRLMNNLYQGLDQGQTPSTALRRAKLGLLHSPGHFRAPFFWAPFQLYSGL